MGVEAFHFLCVYLQELEPCSQLSNAVIFHKSMSNGKIFLSILKFVTHFFDLIIIISCWKAFKNDQLGHANKLLCPLTRPTLYFCSDPRTFIDPQKISNLFQKYRTHWFGQFCMFAEALWIQELKSLFNSMKTLIIALEFAMYSLEL
jgi:hypothetical protein